MIIEVVSPNVIRQVCKCGHVNTIPLKKQSLKFNQELGEYECLQLPACECGCVEVLNMNLAEDEYEISDQIPDHEWRSRSIIKNIRRFMEGKDKEIIKGIPKKKAERRD